MSELAAWDHEDNERTRLVRYRVHDGRLELAGETRVPLAAHEDRVDELVARGVRIGATYAGSGFVWVADEQGWAVWSDDQRVAGGGGASHDIARVRVFLDGADRGHRGVLLERTGGDDLLVAEERTLAAQLDITYGHNELMWETFWAHYLSLHLALWHRVPLENDISPYEADSDLAIARAARALADAVAPAVESAGAVGRSRELSLVLVAGRVDVRVLTAGGATLERPIKRGTRAQVNAFLRRVTTPSAARWAMNALIDGRP